MNVASEINRIARSIQTDTQQIIYHSSSGYLSPEKLETIGAYVREMEQSIQKLTEAMKLT